ncbi:MAG: hypothetical protein QOK42_368, partial [Frankiaceae bacterium]|nr:hypothetical protein [Frankiaceae bacterium]
MEETQQERTAETVVVPAAKVALSTAST